MQNSSGDPGKVSANADRVGMERPAWIPVARFTELRAAALARAQQEQHQLALKRSRGLRAIGLLAVVVGVLSFATALWLKEGGFVITLAGTLAAVGVVAMRAPGVKPEVLRSAATDILDMSLARYRDEQLTSPDFFHSEAWQALRKSTLERSEARCFRCGRRASAMLVVEHIEPREIAPHLALEPSNVEIICHGCRQARSAATGTD